MARKTAARKSTPKPRTARTKAKIKAKARPETGVTLLVATRKGAFILRGHPGRPFAIEGPHFLGHIVHHLVLDPRDGKTLLLAAKTGHLGPTVFHSTDFGKRWKEASAPPSFPKAEDGKGRAVDHVFWLTPGHPSEPGVWYAGTSPQGLFRSEDGGRTWEGVKGLNEHPNFREWTGGEQDGTPDGPKLHSVLIDPRDRKRMYVGMSSGGVFTSDDQGASWRPFNQGSKALFRPDPEPEFGQDPHRIVIHPLQPDRLYQQNHCGIYRIDRGQGKQDRWVRIGDNMPREIGDIGFGIVASPRDPDTAWVFPMDGSTVWPRVSPGGKPAVYITRDAGKSWKRLDRGLPRQQAWFTVKRQAFVGDQRTPTGLYFGTTSGEIWASFDEGAHFTQIAAHLPHIYALETVTGR